jgi:hypothetical protein
VFVFSVVSVNPAKAVIDLQGDINRIVAAINKFDANSAASTSVSSISEIRVITRNNAQILREIKSANNYFKKDLMSAKKLLPSVDTKDSPAFNTIYNLTRGYDQWLIYQNRNQITGERCLATSGNSYPKFTECLMINLSKTLENERIGRMKLQSSWNAWRSWQVKYGYA